MISHRDLPIEKPGADRHNIELKFRCSSLARARARAIYLGAKPKAMLHQIDTYFAVRSGRLKLRETRGARTATLIWYDRPNRIGSRSSHYRLIPVHEPAALKAALASALGILAVVRKRRELLLYDNVRIHLDRVQNLGNFGELEAVVGSTRSTNLQCSRKRLAKVIAVLKIRPTDVLAGSYAEMVGR